ncbi:MAG: 1-acyl-sn-glycerol-3-phosphate acyltransferase [Phaeodactylibacter sp.]|nr:1-acyl-sn-glycerol-3-phosphate acyltransferase [Phaeodactylibacter sp.]MCB9051150.1 1-acyl-sn-glycerol-3-phosphate acyltransferase [Lewinellaceae bacterium]
MFRVISNFLLRTMGWEIITEYEELPRKCVIIAVPHTSNLDFPIGLMVRSVLGFDAKYVGKDSLFKNPILGAIMRWLGGYPVDRSKRSNFVDAVVDIFDSKEDFIITIAPEGTRKKVDKLKTGFYYIALGAKVPIIMVKFDWEHKEIVFSKPFHPTGDAEADFAFITSYFRGVKGRNPEKSFAG